MYVCIEIFYRKTTKENTPLFFDDYITFGPQKQPSDAIKSSELILNSDGSIYHLNLKPADIADTIIAVGDPSRVYEVSQHFDEVFFEMNRREFITQTGLYKGKPLTVMSTGMGTDNIEIFMTELDALVNVDFKSRTPERLLRKLTVIRIGTSGSIQKNIPVGTHLATVTAVGLDSLMQFYNPKQYANEVAVCQSIKKVLGLEYTPYASSCSENLLRKLGFDMTHGITVTCPGFYGAQGRHIRLNPRHQDFIDKLSRVGGSDFTLTNLEMETAGYYALGRLLGHEMLSVNAILANRATGEFASNPQKVVSSLIKKVLERV